MLTIIVITCYNVVDRAAAIVMITQHRFFDRETNMKIYNKPIYLFESLMYLMRRLNEQPFTEDAKKLVKRHPGHEEELEAAFAPVIKLAEYLDENVDVSNERYNFFFKPIVQKEESDAEPVRYCRVQCIGYILLSQGIFNVIRHDLPEDEAFDYMRSMSDEDFINTLLFSVKLEELEVPSFSAFFDSISSNLSNAELKFTLINLFMNRKKYIDELKDMLSPVCEIIREKAPLYSCALDGFGELAPAEDGGGSSFISCCQFDVQCTENVTKIYPFLMGLADYAAIATDGCNREQYIIGGIFRAKVMQFSADDTQNLLRLKNLTKTIGDSSRFDMLIYLRDHSAYGQEIAKEMELFFTTVSHHISKLSAAGLLDFKLSGGKGYYTMNKPAVYNFCKNLKSALLGDWLPDEEKQ